MKIVFIVLCILLVSVVSATVVTYGNSITSTVSIKTTCTDGLDNDGDGLIDLLDPDCVNKCDTENVTLTECI